MPGAQVAAALPVRKLLVVHASFVEYWHRAAAEAVYETCSWCCCCSDPMRSMLLLLLLYGVGREGVVMVSVVSQTSAIGVSCANEQSPLSTRSGTVVTF